MVNNRTWAIVEDCQIKVNSNATIALVDGSPMVSDEPQIIGYINAASGSGITITQWMDGKECERQRLSLVGL